MINTNMWKKMQQYNQSHQPYASTNLLTFHALLSFLKKITFKKQNKFLEQGKQQGKYTETEDKAFNKNCFQDFIYGHFKDLEHFYKMCTVSNQLCSSFATAKTQNSQQ